MKQLAIVASICIASISLSGCGFHLRNKQAWPMQLTHLNYVNKDIPTQENYPIIAFLKSMDITFNSKAQLQLIASGYSSTESIPSSQNSSIPSLISSSMSITFSIMYNNKVCIAPFSLSSTYSQLEPSQNVVAATANPDTQQRLIQNIIEQLYERLTSSNTQHLLTLSQCHDASTKKTNRK